MASVSAWPAASRGGTLVQCSPVFSHPSSHLSDGNSCLCGHQCATSHISVLQVTSVCYKSHQFLPGAWRYRVSIGTGRPGVSIL